jgi:transposase
MDGTVMANQYTDNFKNCLEAKHNKPLADILSSFACKGLNYSEVAKISGFKIGTVRKWCAKYRVTLIPFKVDVKAEKAKKNNAFIESLKVKSINRLNAYSRKWVA